MIDKDIIVIQRNNKCIVIYCDVNCFKMNVSDLDFIKDVEVYPITNTEHEQSSDSSLT